MSNPSALRAVACSYVTKCSFMLFGVSGFIFFARGITRTHGVESGLCGDFRIRVTAIRFRVQIAHRRCVILIVFRFCANAMFAIAASGRCVIRAAFDRYNDLSVPHERTAVVRQCVCAGVEGRFLYHVVNL